MMKKRLFLLLCIVAMLLSMAACGGGEESPSEKEEEKKPSSSGTVEKTPEVDNEEQTPAEPVTPPAETPDETPDEKPNEPTSPSGGNNDSSDGEADLPSTGASVSDWSSKDLTADEIRALLNDPYMILVNRQNKIDSNYEPMDMTTYAGYKLNKTCANALKKLIQAGSKAGYTFTMYSGYRTYDTQYNKYYNKINYYKNQGYTEEKAIELTDQYYAQPGASEHHTGLAADVCIARIVNKYGCLHENYDQTAEFKWFSTHAHEYGFILRYGKTQKSITGYNYEPWHYRYVGVDVANEIYHRGITYEEFIWELQDRLAELEG